jgi:hypothetical protein
MGLLIFYYQSFTTPNHFNIYHSALRISQKISFFNHYYPTVGLNSSSRTLILPLPDGNRRHFHPWAKLHALIFAGADKKCKGTR